ncbi:hypothetical protein TD95_000189 [Thielaviopsis punctulata]|uniref:SHSP domain-containing protein n=1 Tax=Thielaviopsis punctulata TaxID=72032 RepID=A0A0F4ZDS1_9PEZI|nr:hypothetical protein TD95_000189 [Thielaviopsis punctulata]
MAFFAPAFTTDNLSPFFRLLNNLDGPSFEASPAAFIASPSCRRQSRLPTFQPKFDVRETADTYELHGELAGLSKKDVHIEFTDPQTLVVRGRVERSYSSKPADASKPVEAPQETKAVEEAKPAEQESAAPASPKFHKATVEDSQDKDDAFSVTSMSSTHTAPHGEQTETQNEAQKQVQQQQQTPAPEKKTEAKYWVQERSVGEFSRTFSFPRLVRQDDVHASLENGILTVVVPKARMEPRRVVVV